MLYLVFIVVFSTLLVLATASLRTALRQGNPGNAAWGGAYVGAYSVLIISNIADFILDLATR